MFRLRDLKNGLYQIHAWKGQAFEGTIRPICVEAMRMGVLEKELARALVAFEKTGMNYADFGKYGNLLAVKRGPVNGSN